MLIVEFYEIYDNILRIEPLILVLAIVYTVIDPTVTELLVINCINCATVDTLA